MADLNENYVSIGKAALLTDISHRTLMRWYHWWENQNIEHPADMYLPPYYHKNKRKIRFFKKEDIHHFTKFQEQLKTTHRGAMSNYNVNFSYGKRGRKQFDAKGGNSHDYRHKF